MKRLILLFVVFMAFSQLAYSANYDLLGKEIEETGQAVIDTANYPDPAQAKLMAKSAATMDAKRNLLEKILDLNLDADTKVADSVTDPGMLDPETSGLIMPYTIVDENYDNGICTITIKSDLSYVRTFLKERE